MKRMLPAWWLKWAIAADEVCTRVGQSFRPLPRARYASRPLRLSNLEPRLLFSATPIDVASLSGADGAAMVAIVEMNDSSTSAQSDSNSIATLAEASTEQLPSEIVFVDSAVPDLQQLLEGIDTSGRNVEVFILDAERDGVDQITEVLNSRSDVSSIHIVSHAREGAVRLGNTWLSQNNLAGYAGHLASWQSALTSNADLLFYGCDLASGDAGQSLLDGLSALTGADVAASIDDTGNASMGGDWELEYKHGSIESDIAFTTDVQANWNELLAAPTLSVRQEFLVNTTTAGNQSTVGSHQAVAVDGSGNYIVVWSDDGADGQGWGVYAQRFDSNGNALGSEFQVNVVTAGDQKEASVAMNDSGQFVITYTDYTGVNGAILMRRFAADGTAIDASDVHVNVGYTAGNQHNPTVAINASAQVVIAWQSDGTTEGLYTQAFDFTTPIASNNLTTSTIIVDSGADASLPSVAINDSGRFVVTWDQAGEVYSRRYNHGLGTALSAKHDMNLLSDGSQSGVAIRSDGTYVVTFRSSNNGLYFRAANADGSTPVGSISILNDTAAQALTISMDSSGAFIVGYQRADSSGQGIYFRKFFSNNAANGSEFQVNTSTDSDQKAVSIGALDGSNFIAVWSGKGTQTNNNDTLGVFAKQFGTEIAHTVTVNTTLDTNDGDTSSIDALLNNRGTDGLISLREAIQAANNTINGTLPDHIHFNIVGTGPHAIDLLSTLPAITNAVIIDGTTETDFAGSPVIVLNGTNAGGSSNGLQLTATSGGSTIRGLVIQAFSGQGILIESSNNLIVGNFIGTDVNGTTNIGNAGNGISIKNNASNNTVGGTAPADRNVIAGNGANGILVSGSQATGNRLIGNRITENGGLGIALVSSANAGQNYPTITLGEVSGADLVVEGTLGTSPNATFTLHFYASSIADGSAHGEAAIYVGSTTVNTGGDGNGSFNVAFNGASVAVGQYITATATDSNNNTSEFSQNYVATVPNRAPVADAGGPYAIDEGSSLAIDAIGSSDLDFDTLSYQWDIDGDSVFGETGEPSTAIATVTWATLAGLGVTAEGEHTLRVRVSDGRGKSNIQSTTFTVINVAPTFSSTTTVSANENQVSVQTVSASDPVDSLTYSINGGSDAGLFNIVGSTGVLTFKLAPNFESPQDQDGNNAYNVQVAAYDGTTTVSQLVTVTVSNVNEPPTDITLSNATVAENSSGAVIGNVGVVDPDAGDTHTWSVDDARFEIVGTQLKLKAGQALDHETEPTLTLSLTAKDQAGTGLTYSESFTVTVNNVNEAPTDITLSNATVAENNSVAAIGNVGVVDPDAGDTHTWSVDDARFEIVGNQLKLKAGQALDHETEPTLTLSLTARDQAGTGLTYSESFTVTVNNVNEAPTDITLSNATVAENNSGAAIGNVGVVDPDAGDTHTWSVDDARFEIVGNQLKLKAGQALDHETEPTLTLSLTARDQAGTGLGYNKSFRVTVSNVNEVPTEITLSHSTVQGNSPGASVGSLAVADPDVGDTHIWSVSDSRFTVVDGILKLKPDQRMASHIEPFVDVTVTALDASGLSLAKTFTITVKAPQIIIPVSPSVPANNTSTSNTSANAGDSVTDGESKGEVATDRNSGNKSSKDGDSSKQAEAGTGVGNQAAKGQIGVMQGMANQSDSQGSPALAPAVLSLANLESSDDEGPDVIDGLVNSSMVSTHSYANESTSAGKMTGEDRFSTELRHLGVTGSSSLATQANYAMMTRPGEMWQELDQHNLEVESQIKNDLIVVGTAGAAASSFTVGVIAWGLRTGFLASGLLAQLPAWRSIDPLLIMQGAGQGDNESLEELMKRRSDALDDVESATETIG